MEIIFIHIHEYIEIARFDRDFSQLWYKMWGFSSGMALGKKELWYKALCQNFCQLLSFMSVFCQLYRL